MPQKTYKELLDDAMYEYYIETLGLTEKQLTASAKQRYEMVRGETIVALLEKEVGIKGKTLLDVGSGWGEVIYNCFVHGAKVYGVEPYKTSLDVAAALMHQKEVPHYLSQSVGEALPFPDGAFDIITCNHVLEHVNNPPKVIAEIIRVTAPGGYIFLAFPNYVIPFEGHYRLPWIPFMPKKLGTVYLKMLRRNPSYFNQHINYVTYQNILPLLQKYPIHIRCLTKERLDERLNKNLPLFSRTLLQLQLKFNLYKSVTFLLKKL